MRTYRGAQARAAELGVVGDFSGAVDPAPETGIDPVRDP